MLCEPPELKVSGYPAPSGSLTLSRVPSLRNVQPWNGQVSVIRLSVLRRQIIAPRCAHALIRQCSSPSLSRVITTGWRPMYVVK